MTYFRGFTISTHPVASYMYVQVYRIKKRLEIRILYGFSSDLTINI